MSGTMLVARILFSLLFLASGFGHLAQTDAMTGYAQSKGIPSARAAVLVSGALLVVGALSVLLGVYGDLGALVLAATLVPITAGMHRFWELEDPMARQTEQVMFMKNVALIGGALAIFVVYGLLGDALDFTLTDSVFTLTP
ncbi:MAG: DoxX family protein [Actinomyces sp.]|nr:MAG: DoxX family protein [Actinomyces sp.]